MRKTISVLLSLVMLVSTCFCFGTSAFAQNVLTVSVANGTDAKQAVQEALNTNRNDSSNPLKVVVPAGQYTLSDHLLVYSNTTLDLTGVTFKKNYSTGTMITIGHNTDVPTGDSYYKDITITGGVLDADGASGKKVGTIIKFFHASNITISGVTLKNCCNAHHIDFAGCSNVTITGCTFDGHYATGNNAKNNMEALQLDILEESHFPDLNKASYDGTMSKNVTITGNTFKNVDRGLGTHSAFAGKYIDNVTITNNSFTNIDGYAITTFNYRNVNISSNTLKNCGSGIYYRSANPENANLYATGLPGQEDPGTVIANNTIEITKSGDKYFTQFPYAIRLYGEVLSADAKIEGGSLKAGDYRAKNITISNNDITINCCANGLWLVGAVGSNTFGNTVKYNSGDSAKECFPVRVENSSDVNVEANTIEANGVAYVQNGIITDKSKNTKITGNTISKAKKNGINISTKSTAVLTNNTVTGNGENGIFCYDSSSIKTSGNTVKNNKKHGIFIVNCSNTSTLSKDKVSSNKNYGIALQNSKAKFTSEKTTKNGWYGIFLTQKASATISKCTASSNKKEGMYATQSSKANISGGVVESNGGCGIYFTNKAKGSIKNITVKKNKKTGIYLTKKVGKITISKVKYSGNKGGKIKK